MCLTDQQRRHARDGTGGGRALRQCGRVAAEQRQRGGAKGRRKPRGQPSAPPPSEGSACAYRKKKVLPFLRFTRPRAASTQ